MKNSSRHIPSGPPPGDVNFYIQRGATIQTNRMLGDIGSTGTAGIAHPIDTLIAYPFPWGLTAVGDQLNFNVTAGAAGSSARVGIYRAISSKNVYPGALLVGSGAISTVAAGYQANAITYTLGPGLYWAVYVAGVLAPTISSPVAASLHHPLGGWTAANPPARNLSLRVAFAFAALPATFPGGAAWNVGTAPQIFGRFSA